MLYRNPVTSAAAKRGVFHGDQCIFMASPARLVPQLTDDLFHWIKQAQGSVHPLILSSVFHYEFVFIHPFSNGNGRMARLWHTEFKNINLKLLFQCSGNLFLLKIPSVIYFGNPFFTLYKINFIGTLELYPDHFRLTVKLLSFSVQKSIVRFYITLTIRLFSYDDLHRKQVFPDEVRNLPPNTFLPL